MNLYCKLPSFWRSPEQAELITGRWFVCIDFLTGKLNYNYCFSVIYNYTKSSKNRNAQIHQSEQSYLLSLSFWITMSFPPYPEPPANIPQHRQIFPGPYNMQPDHSVVMAYWQICHSSLEICSRHPDTFPLPSNKMLNTSAE